jgi:exopolysaccharide biosynthesis polyprenyl glycosylphosphotransferase
MLLLLRVGDILVGLCAWALAYLVGIVADRLGRAGAWIPVADLVPAVFLTMVFCAVVFSRFGLYQPQRLKTFWMELSVILRAVAVAWCVVYVIASLMRRPETSRFILTCVLPCWLLLACLSRMAVRILLRRLRRRGWNLRHAVIIGTGRLGQTLYHCLRRNPWTGIEPRYFVGHQSRDNLLGLEVFGPYQDMDAILENHPADIAFIALSGRDREAMEDVLNRLAATELDVRVVPDMLSFHFLKHEMGQIDNLPFVTLTYTPLQGWNIVIKRTLDVIFSAAAILALSPLMTAMALVVKLTSPGPVFYRQVRTSLGGKPFRIIKFRTMVVDAERETGPVWAAKDDPRVTSAGKLLRRLSLDELPQLFNVLRGDMSLVGPRPERPELVERFRRQIPRYMLRHHAKAGLTGWAQANGLRGQTSLRKRVQYDMFYIANWSLGLDLRILLLTLVRIFQ